MRSPWRFRKNSSYMTPRGVASRREPAPPFQAALEKRQEADASGPLLPVGGRPAAQFAESDVEAVIPLRFTPMVVVPVAKVVARPALTGALAIVATDATAELQCELMVTSWVVPSLNVPVAVNCWVDP